MAINSMDGLVAAFKAPQPIVKSSFTGNGGGFLHSTFYVNGLPGAGVAPSSGMAGAALTANLTGQIPFPSPVSGQSVYLAGLDYNQAFNIGGVIIADRLWQQSGIVVTTTTAQTVNSVTFPARDANGQTLGAGVMIGLECSTATGNLSGIGNTTASYTNAAGVGGFTGTFAGWPASAVQGTFNPMLLASSDGSNGVRSVQSITLNTSYVSGAINLVAYRVLAWLGSPLANVNASKDFSQLGLPLVYDNSVPWLIYLSSSGAGLGATYANINWAQG